MEPEQLKRIVEAALLASSQPLTIPQLLTLFAEQPTPSHDDVARALEALAADAQTRGVELKEVASGFRFQVREDVNPWVSRLWTERQTRYSRAQLETLALIAYRQPMTRGEIEQIRGVAVSSNIVKTLEEREWIRVVGYRDVPGKPELFGTTRTFLDYFNLKSLDELPPLADIRELHDFEPQLGLAPVSVDGAAPVVYTAESGESDEDSADVNADGEAPPASADPANPDSTSSDSTKSDSTKVDSARSDSTKSDSSTSDNEAVSDADAAATEHNQA